MTSVLSPPPPRQQKQYHSLLKDRSRSPRYKGEIDCPDYVQEYQNPTCGDSIKLMIKLSADQEKIDDIKHNASGCVVSIVSADLMAEVLLGKSISEAKLISQKFFQMILHKVELSEGLNKLNALSGVSQFPLKAKCASLCWTVLDDFFKYEAN